MSVEAHLAVLEAELASLKAEIAANLCAFKVAEDRRLMADARRLHADIAHLERALGLERSAIIERELLSLAIKRRPDKRSPGATV